MSNSVKSERVKKEVKTRDGASAPSHVASPAIPRETRVARAMAAAHPWLVD
jgi:hypothetical protein